MLWCGRGRAAASSTAQPYPLALVLALLLALALVLAVAPALAQTGRQTDRQTDRQTGRKAERCESIKEGPVASSSSSAGRVCEALSSEVFN